MQTFTKSERICSKVVIDKVFERGRQLTSPSFKLIWMKAEKSDAESVQILISVPKRNFKRAVDRNKLKRRIREAYRKNKIVLYNEVQSQAVYLMLIYTGKEMIEYNEIEEKIVKLLQRLIVEIQVSCSTAK